MEQAPKISLKAARVNAGLNQKAAAKQLGITDATLHSYEIGRTIPDYDVVQKISELYKYPLDLISFGPRTN